MRTFLLSLFTSLSLLAVTNETEVNSAWKLLYFDDFEDGTFGNYTDGGTDSILNTSATYSYSGNNSLLIRDNSTTSFSEFSSNMNLADKYYQKLRIHFKYYVRSFTGEQHFTLKYSSDGGDSWIDVRSFDLNDFTNNSFRDAEIFLAEAAYNFTNTFKIRFECEGGNDDDRVYLDDISIHATQFNTVIGESAGQNNTTGKYNIFVGKNSGHRNTTGNFNTFLGLNSGLNNTTGHHNTFLGLSAGVSNSNGYENTFVGRGAGENNTTGFRNTFIGRSAGDRNTSAAYNTFIGNAAGFNNTTADYNTFIGFNSGYSNTTGIHNTFMGVNAGHYSTTGNYNVILGVNSGFVNNANHNVFIGHQSGKSNTSGYGNTYLGTNSGLNNNSGYYNIFIGIDAGAHETSSNKLYIENSDSASPLIYGDFAEDELQVNGELRVTNGIRTNEVNVQLQSAWPDYVFADDYQLPTIAEMANHIKEHKHLPGVPSAAEIAKDGLDMAKVMTAQMEKIEELSLYIIELEKKNQKLESQFKSSIETNHQQIQSILQKLEGK